MTYVCLILDGSNLVDKSDNVIGFFASDNYIVSLFIRTVANAHHTDTTDTTYNWLVSSNSTSWCFQLNIRR